MSTPACAPPIDVDVLIDYWLGALASDAEAAVETHLFGCAACSAKAQAIADLAGGLRALVSRGLLGAVVTEGLVQRAAARGLQVRTYTIARGGSVNCTIAPEDDLLVARLQAPLAGLARIDVLMLDSHGRGVERVRDVPFDAGAGAILLAARAAEVRALPAHTSRMQLLAVDAGVERLLGEYTFNHSPWPVRPDA